MYVLLLSDSSGRTLVVGPFDDEADAISFGASVSQMVIEDLTFVPERVFTPTEYLDND